MDDRQKVKLEAISIPFVMIVALLVSVGIRVGWLVIDFGSLENDPDAYKALAEGYSTSGTFGRMGSDSLVRATAYRPPGYVWLLSWLVMDGKLNDLAVGILHGVLGGLTCCLVARIAFLLSANYLIAAAASMCVAVDPILLRQSTQTMTETLATFIAMSLWWGWIEMNVSSGSPWASTLWMLLLGITAGIGSLVRPTTLVSITVWILLCTGLQLWSNARKKKVSTINTFGATDGYGLIIKDWAVFLVGMALVMTPWVFRNATQIGRATMTTTHGGYTILLANNPVLYENIRNHGWDRQWDETRFHLLWDQRRQEDPRELEYWKRSEEDILKASSDPPKNFYFGENGEHREVSDDRLASEVAWKTISSDPTTFIKSCFVRMSWFWAVTPYRAGVSRIISLAIGVWYTSLYLCVILNVALLLRDGFHKRLPMNRLRQWIPAVALLLSLMLVHAIYWSNMRMRAPLMPSLYAFLLVSFANLYSRRRIH